MDFVIVFLGGGVGACLRFSISLFIAARNLELWKATLSANLIGTLLLLSAVKFIPETKMNSHFLRIGLLGALTTFSTFSYEFMSAFQQGSYQTMLTILFVNLFGAFFLGYVFLVLLK